MSTLGEGSLEHIHERFMLVSLGPPHLSIVWVFEVVFVVYIVSFRQKYAKPDDTSLVPDRELVDDLVRCFGKMFWLLSPFSCIWGTVGWFGKMCPCSWWKCTIWNHIYRQAQTQWPDRSIRLQLSGAMPFFSLGLYACSSLPCFPLQ